MEPDAPCVDPTAEAAGVASMIKRWELAKAAFTPSKRTSSSGTVDVKDIIADLSSSRFVAPGDSVSRAVAGSFRVATLEEINTSSGESAEQVCSVAGTDAEAVVPTAAQMIRRWEAVKSSAVSSVTVPLEPRRRAMGGVLVEVAPKSSCTRQSAPVMVAREPATNCATAIDDPRRVSGELAGEVITVVQDACTPAIADDSSLPSLSAVFRDSELTTVLADAVPQANVYIEAPGGNLLDCTIGSMDAINCFLEALKPEVNMMPVDSADVDVLGHGSSKVVMGFEIDALGATPLEAEIGLGPVVAGWSSGWQTLDSSSATRLNVGTAILRDVVTEAGTSSPESLMLLADELGWLDLAGLEEAVRIVGHDHASSLVTRCQRMTLDVLGVDPVSTLRPAGWLSVQEEHVWHRDLDVGSRVELFSRWTTAKDSWVEATIISVCGSALGLKYGRDGVDNGEVFVRVRRDSTDIRPLQHRMSKEMQCIKQQDREDRRWRATVESGSVVEVFSSRAQQWLLADVLRVDHRTLLLGYATHDAGIAQILLSLNSPSLRRSLCAGPAGSTGPSSVEKGLSLEKLWCPGTDVEVHSEAHGRRWFAGTVTALNGEKVRVVFDIPGKGRCTRWLPMSSAELRRVVGTRLERNLLPTAAAQPVTIGLGSQLSVATDARQATLADATASNGETKTEGPWCIGVAVEVYSQAHDRAWYQGTVSNVSDDGKVRVEFLVPGKGKGIKWLHMSSHELRRLGHQCTTLPSIADVAVTVPRVRRMSPRKQRAA